MITSRKMEKSTFNVLTIALKNFYGNKGYAQDLRLYQGHSKITTALMKLDKFGKKN